MTPHLLCQARHLLWMAGFLLLVAFTDCAAANLSSDKGKLNLIADGNVDLTVAHENDSSYKEQYNKKKGFLSSKSRLNIDQSQSDTAVGNSLSADSINIQAGRDLTATGAKTLDTTTAAKVNNPSQVYYSLKGNIDAAAKFTVDSLGTKVVDSANISVRELQVAIPENTTSAQWTQINRAIDYAKTKGVVLKVTKVK